MITYKIHHVNGLYFQLTGDNGKNREYDITFLDRSNNEILFETKLKINHWSRLNRKYLSDISVIVRHEGRTITQINFLDEIKGNRVFISFESKAIGDSIAWIPYCVEFAKHYNCEVIVSTFKNFLFEKAYPELTFVDRGVTVNNIIGMFEFGWFWDKNREPVNPILVPLQQTASNILHLPYKEIKSKVVFEPDERPIENKYVCISTQSTSQLKYWDYWQDMVDFLVSKGYEVIEISKDPSNLKNLSLFTDKSMQSTMNAIHHCEFFMGLSSGLSWLSWALNKQVVMIANFTEANHEFTQDCIRITNLEVCNSCWNNPVFRFDKGNWNWCPEHEDTPRQFECHKSISSQDVISKINHLI